MGGTAGVFASIQRGSDQYMTLLLMILVILTVIFTILHAIQRRNLMKNSIVMLNAFKTSIDSLTQVINTMNHTKGATLGLPFVMPNGKTYIPKKRNASGDPENQKLAKVEKDFCKYLEGGKPGTGNYYVDISDSEPLIK